MSPMLGVVLIHGSRDPRPQAAAVQLLATLATQLPSQTPFQLHPVPTTLELGETPLPQQLLQLVQQAQSQKHQHLRIFPLFLLPGNHVQADLPEAVRACRAHLPSQFNLSIAPPLGQDPQFGAWLRSSSIATNPSIPWILLAHGSQRPEAQLYLHHLAQALEMTLATWAMPPHLDDRVKLWIDRGAQHLGVLPLFLFEGSITQAVAEQVHHLQLAYPQHQWSLLPPLSQQPGFTDLVQTWLLRTTQPDRLSPSYPVATLTEGSTVPSIGGFAPKEQGGATAWS